MQPEGLVYEPKLLTKDEERELLEHLERLEFREIHMHGVVAKRTTRHFGVDYDYNSREISETEPPPDWLLAARAKAAELAGVAPEDLAEVLVTRYPEGAQIGWHRDAPMFGTVVGISLAGEARMRFRRGPANDREQTEIRLEPRSGYVLDGPARTQWQHHVPPTKSLRYSITFRTLRRPRA